VIEPLASTRSDDTSTLFIWLPILSVMLFFFMLVIYRGLKYMRDHDLEDY
jgi:hypothetical protein